MPESPAHRLNITVPPDVAAGYPVDFAGVWRTQESLVIDFSVQTEPTRIGDDGVPVLSAQTVARVRVPVAQGFEIMKALNTQLTAWENERPNRQR